MQGTGYRARKEKSENPESRSQNAESTRLHLISISKKARREELTRIESPGAFLVCNQVYGKGHDMNTTRTFEDLKV